jgi:hypothetical protein
VKKKKARIEKSRVEEKVKEEEEELVDVVVEPMKKKRAAVKNKRPVPPTDVNDDVDYADDVDDEPEAKAPAHRDDVEEEEEEIAEEEEEEIEVVKSKKKSSGQKRKVSEIIDQPTAADIAQIKKKYYNDRRNVPNDARNLPNGYRHVRIQRVGNTATSLGIPYARGLVGFDKFYGRWVPVFDGVIIHASSYNDLMTGVNYKHAKQNRMHDNRVAAAEKAAAKVNEERERVLERQKSLDGAYTSATFEQKLADSGLADVPSAVRAVRVAVGKTASAMSSAAATKEVDAAIAKVRERLDALRALAARVDVHELPKESDFAAVLDGSAPIASALASLCGSPAVARGKKKASWRTALAARCTPVATAIDDATLALLKQEIAVQVAASVVDDDDSGVGEQIEPVFGLDEKYRMAWLVGADDDGVGVARRLAKFDATLAERGIVGTLSNELALNRRFIAGGRKAIEAERKKSLEEQTLPELRAQARDGGFNLHGATRKEDILQLVIKAKADLFDADGKVDEFLRSEAVRVEAAEHVALSELLRQFHHDDLREAVLSEWHLAVSRERACGRVANLPVRPFALSRIAAHRGTLFDKLATDFVVYTWDRRETIRSDFARLARAKLVDVSSVVVSDRTSDEIVGEAAARVNAQITQWKAEHERAVAGGLQRKGELERLLAARGYTHGPDYKFVRARWTSAELDLRQATVVEFSGGEPNERLGVRMDGQLFAYDNNGIREVSRAEAATLKRNKTSLANATALTMIWGAELTEADRAVLRWPMRLTSNDTCELRNIVENPNVPLRLPVDIEARAARRNALLSAIRAQGVSDKRIPLSVSFADGPIFMYLCKPNWPRSRATTAALVGDVAVAKKRRDIFASLPQLVISNICEYLVAAGDRTGFTSLIGASEAFALGAAVWAGTHLNDSRALDARFRCLCGPYTTLSYP